jgi:hypothetical protein
MATWPVTLPQLPLMDGYSESSPDGAIRTSMEVGPGKSRKRISAVVRPTTWPLYLETSTQVDALMEFHDDTLAMGALPFDHPHPRKGGSNVSFRFTGGFVVVPRGVGYHTELPLEIMP